MKKIDWDNIQYFKQGHFPENPIYAEPELIYHLDFTRMRLAQRIYPSPVKGALARFSGNSKTQHYAVGRKSTAVDVFCEGYPLVNFLSVLQLHVFNGIGIYLDTNGPDGLPWVMFHFDMRKKPFSLTQPLIWIVKKEYSAAKDKMVNVYCYPQRKLEYWKLLRQEQLYDLKKFGVRSTSTISPIN